MSDPQHTLIEVLLHPGEPPRGGGDATWVVCDALGAGVAIVSACDDGPDAVDVPADLLAAMERCGAHEALVCTLQNLRPVAAALPAVATSRVIIVCAGGSEGEAAAEDIALAGLLCRMLVDEFAGAAVLDDAAGIALTVAMAAPEVSAVLESGAYGRALRQSDNDAELRAAARMNSSAAMPLVSIRSGAKGTITQMDRLPSLAEPSRETVSAPDA